MKGRARLTLEWSGGVTHWRIRGENDPLCVHTSPLVTLLRVAAVVVDDGIPSCLWCLTWRSRHT